MRRSLIVTAGAAITMVLLAMLVPMAVLVRSYALEDRLSRAALEVQATETVVSRDKGAVAAYIERLNRTPGSSRTTVLYPDGTAIGPDPGEDSRVDDARNTGRARVDDVPGGSQILVPVSRGGNSALPSQTPVVRVIVEQPGLTSAVGRAWLALAALGLVLLAGSLVVVDRLGRSFVQPIRRLADYTQTLGQSERPEPVEVSGPVEVEELADAINRLVGRIELLLSRERETVADLSHRLRTPVTALRLRIDSVADPADRARLSADLDELQATVDRIVRDARRSEREGLDPRTDAVAVLADRVRYWEPLAEEQGRRFEIGVPEAARFPVRTSEADLGALADVLLDNVFTHTPDGTPVAVSIALDGELLRLTVADGGPGFPEGMDPAGRGASGADSTGLGLAIVERTATESGGGLRLGRSPSGGALVEVTLGRA